jgi:signal transduction histidine kinase/ActR/RegA family two-component response regulator
MTTDSRLLRSERHTEIGQIIQRDASLLIDRWCQRAIQEQPNTARLHHGTLRDQLPGLLWALGHSLAEPDDPALSRHRLPALEHGEQRWENGWSLPEVVRDYQILRLVIVDYLAETLDRPLRSCEILAVGLVLDDAIAASVGMYVSNREQYVVESERQRAERERQAREALQEANRRKDEFLATLAHELRNPLGSVRNATEILCLCTPAGPAGQAREIIERQVQQMARLVDDLLDITRIAQGKLELRKEPIDLAGAVGPAVQAATSLIKDRRHKLDVRLPAESLWLEADQVRIVQILSNLLTNAAKYTDPGGHIELAAEQRGDRIILRVRDNGVGIPAEKLPHIFEMFIQLDPGQGRSPGGLGVGLTLVRKLVEMHGGTVAARSDGSDKGSEFIIELPAAARGPESPLDAGQPAKGPARHILVVEDCADGRETLRLLLTLLGHRVETAEDGLRGIDAARANRPRVVLIDIGLPRMDGLQVARKLREEFGQEHFLIALTGYARPEDRRQAYEAGFDAHLTKPVEVAELMRLLRDLRPMVSR